MAKIINISKDSAITISDLSIVALAPGEVAIRSDAAVEASADAHEYILANNFIEIKWDKGTLVTREEFEANASGDIIDPTALIASHAAKTTGVHGVGGGTIAKVADIATDSNLSSAAQAVVTAGACDVDANLSSAAQAVVTAGACDVDANLSSAAQAAITASHAQYSDLTKIVAVESGASVGGGGATESLAVTDLAAGDTILSVVNSTAGATPANCIVIAFSYVSPAVMSVTWIGDPGASAKVTVCLKKA